MGWGKPQRKNMKKTEITNEQKKEIRDVIDNLALVFSDGMSEIYKALNLSQATPTEESK